MKKVHRILHLDTEKIIKSGLLGTFFVICMIQWNYYGKILQLNTDETWFMRFFDEFHITIAKGQIFHIDNNIGYGQLYWWIGAILDNVFALRAIAYLGMVSLSILIYLVWKRNHIEEHQTLSCLRLSFALFVWWMSPLCWFYHKIIGPEILSLVFAAWGGYFCWYSLDDVEKSPKNKMSILGGILLGCSISIKINNVVCLFIVGTEYILYYFGCIKWKTKDEKWRTFSDIIRIIVSTVVTFVLFNPILIYDFPRYISNILRQTNRNREIHFRTMQNVLFNRSLFDWSGAYSGGLFGELLCVVLFIILMYLGPVRIFKRRWISLFLGMIACCIISYSESYFGWYMMPIALIPAMLILIIDFNGDKRRLYLLSIGMIVNFVIMVPLCYKGLDIKYQYIDAEYNYDRMARVEKAVTDIRNGVEEMEVFHIVCPSLKKSSYLYNVYPLGTETYKKGIYVLSYFNYVVYFSKYVEDGNADVAQVIDGKYYILLLHEEQPSVKETYSQVNLVRYYK